MQIREQPSRLAQMGAVLRVKAENDVGLLFALRLKKSIFAYLLILIVLWSLGDYRRYHFSVLMTVTILVIAGAGIRRFALVARERIWLQSPERWYRLIAITVLLLGGSLGFLLAHTIVNYGFANSNSAIIMIWNTGLVAGSIVTLSPNTRIFRLQLVLILLPALVVAFWVHSSVSLQYSLGNLTMLIFSFLQAKQITFDLWEQLINRALEDQRREELGNARLATQAALLAAAEAREAARVRTEFLANMSHEIRTPLNAVVGMTSLVLDQNVPPETIDCIKVIQSSADALLVIINDILDFSRIESGELTVQHEAFCLRDCVQEVLELLVGAAGEKNLELAARIDAEVSEWVYGDVARVRQILLNLVGNAVKFTSQGEVVVSVQIRQREDGSNTLHLAVRDTGIGIPQEKIGGLFRAFTQVDSSTTRRFGGTGLGLAISKRLTELMGGTIGVSSASGIGSVFQFEIPYQAAAGEASLGAAFEGWGDKRILIVDDNETSRLILTSQLKAWNVTSLAVASGNEALAAIRSERWDAALLDWQMPEMNGAELAFAVREEFGSNAPPMVMLLSGNASPKKVFGDAVSPVGAVLSKPFRRRQLRHVLSQVLDGINVSQAAPLTKVFDVDFAKRVPLRILLVEDNPLNQKVAVRMLERLGYHLDVVANGVEAVEALRHRPCDIVLMDVHMPEMNGLDATRQIIAVWGADHPWITALTAGTLRENRDECAAAGMDDFLPKPLQVRELEEALKRCFNSVQARAKSGPRRVEPVPIQS